MENKINTVIEEILKEKEKLLSPNSLAFLSRIYLNGIDHYLNRIKAINFINGTNVLDAGCGFGQWSLLLSEVNNNVYSLDSDSARLFLFDLILFKINKKNISLQFGKLDYLPYKDHFFDFIFCYQVMQYTPWKEVLREFYRTLRIGGRLYFTINDIGWYIHCWQNSPNKVEGYDPKNELKFCFSDTLNYNQYNLPPAHIIISKEEVSEYLLDIGFGIIDCKGEGKINLNKNSKSFSFFNEEYCNLPGIFEFLVEKK